MSSYSRPWSFSGHQFVCTTTLSGHTPFSGVLYVPGLADEALDDAAVVVAPPALVAVVALLAAVVAAGAVVAADDDFELSPPHAAAASRGTSAAVASHVRLTVQALRLKLMKPVK